jgi:cation diffusion facilitator CzcD-associated flavoprotein CzcO
MPERFDCIVIGAGIAGIDAAYHLSLLKGLTFTVLEKQDGIGGTWRLFQYPGVRSDSDMFTFSYSWRPWTDGRALSPGADIRRYLEDACDAHGLCERMRFGVHVVAAEWSSQRASWRLTTGGGEVVECSFLISCAGYYDHDRPNCPTFPGAGQFCGEIVHPQFWKEDQVSFAEKRVVVLGSGATAITLVPNLVSGGAAHVTMLQRSPSFIMSTPNVDEHSTRVLRDRSLTPMQAHRKIREQKTRWQRRLLDRLERAPPGKLRPAFIALMRQELPEMPDAEFARHFHPRYDPWQQRVCFCPDGDFFEAIKSGDASVVTDRIARFDEGGIALEGGGRIDADLIVTATGLRMQTNMPFANSMLVLIDGRPYESIEHYIYKGCMLNDVPNFAFCTGYFAESYTLKADLVSEYIARVVAHLRDVPGGLAGRFCVPRLPEGAPPEEPPPLNVTASYITAVMHLWPKHGTEPPWSRFWHYHNDRAYMRTSDVADGTLHFLSRREPGRQSAEPRSRL